MTALLLANENGLFQIKNALHRGRQSLLQNFSGNPDSKIVSKSGNPDAFCKMYLEIMEIVTQTWIGIWSNFIKNILKCSLKLLKFSGIPGLENTKKVWNSNLLYGGRTLLSGRAQ